MPVTKRVFDSSSNITLFTISNGWLEVNILDYGATIQSILLADKNQIQRDVVLGFDDLDGYLSKRVRNPYFGASIGRVGNRIANASFELNGKQYSLVANNGPNSLHGGGQGFDKKKWTLTEQGNDYIVLSYTSDHMQAGYPGKLVSSIKYSVTEQNELKLDYTAKLEGDETDATIVNLTNHSYFNLNGVYDQESSQVLNHQVRMHSSNYLEVDDNLIPTGTLLPTKGTDFDFEEGKHTIGERVDSVKPAGYDHCFVLQTDADKFRIDPVDVKKAVVVYSPLTGIRMTFSTGEPGFQFYSGSKIVQGHRPKKSQNDGSVTYGPFSGFCLEAQRFPDAIHRQEWHKQVVLSSNQTYRQSTVYKFEVADQL